MLIADIKNTIIRLEEKLIKSKNFDYPLASGNCGVFAYALSKILTEARIDHHFRIYNDNNDVFRDNDIHSWNDACAYHAECGHIVVIVGDEIYGASLGTAFDNSDAYDIFDMDKDGLLEYVYQETSHWIEIDEFYSGLKAEVALTHKTYISHNLSI